MRLRQASLVLMACVVTAPARAQQTFTLEQVMSAPFPSDLSAGPGGRFVWIQDDRGRRNIWVAEPPAYQGRQVTRYDADDGQELSAAQFTTDGRAVVYVRGGPPNRAGEIPNPTSDVTGAEEAVWTVALDGSAPAPRKVSEGSAPAVAPQGNLVAFLRRGDVWTAALSDSAKSTQLFKARGRQSALTWSPDGSKLAFVSNRGDHAFIGVYDLSAKRLSYLDPSVDRDIEPEWSPDGSQVAFVRIPGNKAALPFIPEREGEPWSIRVVDLASGTAREVWRADPGPGSVFHGIVMEHQVLWAVGDRLVFPWERTGWVHLYSVPVSGGQARELTPGEFEVEHVTPSRDRRELIFSSNQDDIDRRHLWRVAVAGGTPAAVTKGTGIEWQPAAGEGGVLAFLASDARTPAHTELLVPDTPRRVLAQTIPADFPSAQLVEPQQVILSAADGMLIHGQLFLPPHLARGERRPALLFFHGGSRRQMLLGFHYLYYYHNAYAMNQYLASRGYIVLSVNYRSGIGYGMNVREAIDYGAHGASEYRDVMGAGLYLRSRPDVDPNRIGLWGGSYGGYLTALGLARSSDLFKAGVDFHGVHDWNVVIRNFAAGYDATAREEVARLAFQSSPLAAVATWRSPVLLIHGDDDRNVPFSETVDLVEALRQQKVEFEELIFPDEVHDFLLHRHWLQAYHAATAFFDKHLAGPRAAGGRAGR